MRFRNLTSAEKAAIQNLNPDTTEAEKEAVVRQMRAEAKATAKAEREAKTAANKKAREERAARYAARRANAAEKRKVAAARRAEKTPGGNRAHYWKGVARRPKLSQAMIAYLEAHNLDPADMDNTLGGLRIRDAVNREPSTEDEVDEIESITYVQSKWDDDSEDFDRTTITIVLEADEDPWQGFDGGEVHQYTVEELEDYEDDYEEARQERMAELEAEWAKCEYVRTVKKIPAPVPWSFEQMIPPTQDYRKCCTYDRKQHFHYHCSDCGGLAASKNKLDKSKPIFCQECHGIRKAAGYYDQKVAAPTVENNAPAAANEATDAPPAAEQAPAPEPEINPNPAPTDEVEAITEEVQTEAEEIAPEPIVEPPTPEVVVEAPKAQTIMFPWSKLDSGRKVRKVVTLLEELGIVNFGLIKPTTVADLKAVLKAKLGAEWMTKVSISASKVEEALVN